MVMSCQKKKNANFFGVGFEKPHLQEKQNAQTNVLKTLLLVQVGWIIDFV
jgi:hypothetical protein